MVATVIDLVAFERAREARYLVVRMLSSFCWFIGAHLELKADGHLLVIAVTTLPSYPEQRAAIFERVASHLGEVSLETRVGDAGSASPGWRAREQPGTPARNEDEP